MNPRALLVLLALVVIAAPSGSALLGATDGGDAGVRDRLRIDGHQVTLANDGGATLGTTSPSIHIDGRPVPTPGLTPSSEGALLQWRAATDTTTLTANHLGHADYVDARSHTQAPGTDIHVERTITFEGLNQGSLNIGDATLGPNDALLLDAPETPIPVWGTTTTHFAVVAGDIRGLEATHDGHTARITYVAAGADDVVEGVHMGEAPMPHQRADAVATMEATEVGRAWLSTVQSAGLGTISTGATVRVTDETDTLDWWDQAFNQARQWTVHVEADGIHGGRILRIQSGPGADLDTLRVDVTLDTVPSETTSDADDLLLRIPHFSMRAVQIKGFEHGVSPIWGIGAFAFGTMAAGEGAWLGSKALKSRSARQGMQEGHRSQAVQRAMGYGTAQGPATGAAMDDMVPDAVQGNEFKSALLQKMEFETQSSAVAATRAVYTRCTNCQKPIRFEAGDRSSDCDQCGQTNYNTEGNT